MPRPHFWLRYRGKTSSKALCAQVDLKPLERAIAFFFTLFPAPGVSKEGFHRLERWQKGQKNEKAIARSGVFAVNLNASWFTFTELRQQLGSLF